MVDPTDYLEIDLFAESTANTMSGPVAFDFRIDDPILATNAQMRVEEQTVQPIAFDNFSQGATGSSSSLTISHTVASQSNRILVVGTGAEDSSATDCAVSNVTFNSAALTKIASATAGSGTLQCVELWYLLAPDTGTHNIVITWGGAVSNGKSGGISIYNAKQQSPEAQNTSSLDSGTSITTSLTTLTNGAWVIDSVGSGNTGAFSTAQSGQTERYDTSEGSSAMAGSTKYVTTAGSTSMGWSQAANRLAQVIAAFTPE